MKNFESPKNNPEDADSSSEISFEAWKRLRPGEQIELPKEVRKKMRRIESKRFLEKDVRFRKDLKEMIKEWRDEVKPDYIFLNECSSTPYGFLIKAAWKTAYPDEDLPKFYLINPRAIEHADLYGDKAYREWVEYFTRRVKNKNAKVIVFDEAVVSGESSENVLTALSWYPLRAPWRKHPEDREKLGIPEDNISIYRGVGREYKGRDYGDRLDNITEKDIKEYSYRLPIDKFTYTGKTIKDPQARDEALEYINYLESVGSDIGKEMLEEQGK